MNSFFSTKKTLLQRTQNKIRSFTRTQRIIFSIAFVGATIGAGGLVRTIFLAESTVIPARGGVVTEGMVGTPRFINPVLAETSVDLDLTQLVYSGLLRRDPDGALIPDLAVQYSVSQDGKTYLFTMREEIFFHNGRPVNAEDVVFTIAQTQVSNYQSPHRKSWQGIKVTALDNKTVQFQLPQAFAGFLSQTTLGIIPSHLWQTIPKEQFIFSELNIEPVGSGAYTISKVHRNRNRIAEAYDLKANKKYWSGEPFVQQIRTRFFDSEASLVRSFSRGDVDTMAAISPKLLTDVDYEILVTTALPRIFGVFFNTTRQPLFEDEDLVEIINLAIDKQAIIDNVLGTYGSLLAGPLPPTLTTISNGKINQSYQEVLRLRLEELGWSLNGANNVRQKDGMALQFSIATSDIPELVETANVIKRSLADIGILVTINVFEIRNLELDIIQPRNFESLLFGQVVRHDTDLYAFWHSSQSSSEGLNITNYSNPNVDKALETALSTLDTGLRRNLYRTVEEEIIADKPAIFLYSPRLVYATNKAIGNFDIGTVNRPADRLNQTHTWYVNTERIWNFLKKTN